MASSSEVHSTAPGNSDASKDSLPQMTFAVAIECYRSRGIGPLIRSSVAMGASLICIVGSADFGTHGAHGSQRHVRIVHFYCWADCIAAMKGKGFAVIGLSPVQDVDASHAIAGALNESREIDDEDDDTDLNEISINSNRSRNEIITNSNSNKINSPFIPIESYTFSKVSTLFIVGFNDRLTDEMVNISDAIVYCSFPIQSMDRIIKYETKLAICLLQFTKSFPGVFNQQTYIGEKYVIGEAIGFKNNDCWADFGTTSEDKDKSMLREQRKKHSSIFSDSSNNDCEEGNPGIFNFGLFSDGLADE
jgi:hypothetical protein